MLYHDFLSFKKKRGSKIGLPDVSLSPSSLADDAITWEPSENTHVVPGALFSSDEDTTHTGELLGCACCDLRGCRSWKISIKHKIQRNESNLYRGHHEKWKKNWSFWPCFIHIVPIFFNEIADFILNFPATLLFFCGVS